MAKVRLITSDIYQGDAIGNFSIQLRDFLVGKGIVCQLYARYYDKNENLGIRDFDALFEEIHSDDIVFAQFSIYEKGNERFKGLPNKKTAYYHGITPPEYFSGIDSQTEENCALGRQQYHCFKDFDYFLANSQFMLDELIVGVSAGDTALAAKMNSNSAVVPPTLDPLRWEGIVAEPLGINLGETNFICVGRLAPHKKIEDVIDWFQHYLQLDKNSSIVIVGSDAPPAYAQAMRDKVESLPESVRSKIHFVGHVRLGQLKGLYKQSSALLTLSEHEGFCLPLIEAMYFDLPVVARKAAAIPETLGRYDALLCQQSLIEFASQTYSLLNDDGLRQSILGQQSLALKSMLAKCNGKLLMDLLG